MPKFRLYRKDNTFEEIEASGTYLFYEKTHRVYFPSIRAVIKSVYKVEEVKPSGKNKKKKDQ